MSNKNDDQEDVRPWDDDPFAPPTVEADARLVDRLASLASESKRLRRSANDNADVICERAQVIAERGRKLVQNRAQGLTPQESLALLDELIGAVEAARAELRSMDQAAHLRDQLGGELIIRALRKPLSAPELAQLLGLSLHVKANGRVVAG